MTAIQTSKLTKRFPRSTGYKDLLPQFIRKRQCITAVESLDLDVYEGELFGLLGPNGAGKTTLMKMLCTLVVPTSGSAKVCGYDVVQDEQRVKETVGLISAEERSFYWRLTARENLEFYASLYDLPKPVKTRRIDEMLELVGLSDVEDVRFQNFSAGMKQKLAIARGLLSEPKVLFIDEPTKSLDPVSAQAIRAFLREQVVGTGRTAILATHNMLEAEEICDRIAIMDRGRAIARGSVGEMRSLLQNQEECELEIRGLSDTMLVALKRLDGVVECTRTAQHDSVSTVRLRFTSRTAVLPEILRDVVFLGGEIRGCALRELPLEDIFMSVVVGREHTSAHQEVEA